MNTRTLLLLGLLFLGVTVVAQKDKSKGVKTQYMAIPQLDVTQISPNDLTMEYSYPDLSFGTEKMADVKTVCKNNSTGKAVEVPTYYYKVPASMDQTYVVGRNKSGELIFASKVMEPIQKTVNFGYQKCKNHRTDNLKSTWASGGEKFKANINSKNKKEMIANAKSTAKKSIYPFYIPQDFDVYSAKSKTFDYAELDEAMEWAFIAYKDISKSGLKESSKKNLQKAIGVWEKEIQTEDISNKDARINKSISKGLRENCVRAYFMIYDFDQAITHARAFKKLFGNYSNNRTADVDKLVEFVRMQQLAVKRNPDLLNKLPELHELAKGFAKYDLEISILGSADLSRLKADYNTLNFSKHLEVAETQQEEQEILIESGAVNRYQQYVTVTTLGDVLNMNMAPSSLNGFPVLKEFPKEICQLTTLNQIMISSNEISSIPPEIANLTNLTSLTLTNNKLTTLPKEIGQLVKLKKLVLSKNPITSIPDEIGNCKNLKTLVIKDTKLSAESIQKLQKLLPKTKIKQ